MSSSRRPWYPWYPKDFIVDEKVQALSDDAELLYRRILDILWQANDLQMLNNCTKIANAIARGWTKDRFKEAWDEIQTDGFELLKVSKCGKFVYSRRLMDEAEKIESISKKRAAAAKAKQLQSKCKTNGHQKECHTDTYTDIYNTPPPPPLKKPKPKPKSKPKAKRKPKPPDSLQDVVAYFKNYDVPASEAKRAYEYYGAGEWHDAKGDPVLNWKQKTKINFIDKYLAKNCHSKNEGKEYQDLSLVGYGDAVNE